MDFEGNGIAIVGALDAFPKRLARREIEARGGFFRRSLSRRLSWVVFGHRLITTWSANRILDKLDQATGLAIHPVSERTFLQSIGVAEPGDALRDLSKDQLLRQSGLGEADFDLLVLFDAFDFSGEPFGFRDLVAARQYARLMNDGVSWIRLVRAIRRHGRADDGSLSDIRLERSDWNDVVARAGDILTEIDGQHVLSLGGEDPVAEAHDLFEQAELAEDEEDWAAAARLYRRCLDIDGTDPTVPFNLSHALMRSGELQEAITYLQKTLKIDPGYAEAWYNLGSISASMGERDSARRYLEKAIAVDPDYPDPIFNLALMEFEAGRYERAAALWRTYIQLDPVSPWTEKARQGLQLIEMIRNETEGDAHPAGGSVDLKAV